MAEAENFEREPWSGPPPPLPGAPVTDPTLLEVHQLREEVDDLRRALLAAAEAVLEVLKK